MSSKTVILKTFKTVKLPLPLVFFFFFGGVCVCLFVFFPTNLKNFTFVIGKKKKKSHIEEIGKTKSY